jgi:hypothetical protein
MRSRMFLRALARALRSIFNRRDPVGEESPAGRRLGYGAAWLSYGGGIRKVK